MEVPDERVRRFARIFSTVESLGSLRMALGIKRRGGKLHERFFGDFMDTLGQGVSGRILRDLPDIIDMMRWKYIGREGRQVDAQKMG